MKERSEKTETQGARRPGLAVRAAEAVGAFLGRMSAEADRRRGESLAQRPTGRLDHTWSARNSATGRAYDAATQDRTNADWKTGLTSATLAIIEGLDTMLARSRWLVRNDGYAASAQGGYRRKVVGGGITARSAGRHPDTGEMLKGHNAALDALWNYWALEPLLCDQEQTKCLYEKQAVWMDELFVAGGLLLRPVYTPRKDAIGLAIQEIEYEQLNRDLTSYEGRAVYNGIETDQYGAPVAYHVYAAAHPLEETPSAPVRLPANECWHLFRKSRVRQRIGVPFTAPVMTAVRNLAVYDRYMVSKGRTEAAYHGFIEEQPDSGSAMDNIRQSIGGRVPEGESDDGQNLRTRVEEGLFPILRNGRKVSFPQPGTPNSMYPPFVAEQLKRISAGTGLDLPTVARWYADGNFNTQRKASLEIEAEVEAIQDLQFINGVLRRVREMFVSIAVMEKKLLAAGFAASARWRAAYLTTNWQGPPVKSVDPIKDEAAWDLKFLSLRGTPQDYFNERGTSLEEVFEAWQEAFDAAGERPAVLPLLKQFFMGGAANTPKAGMRPDGTNPDGDPADADPGSRVGRGGLAARLARKAVLASLMGEGEGGNGKH